MEERGGNPDATSSAGEPELSYIDDSRRSSAHRRSKYSKIERGVPDEADDGGGAAHLEGRPPLLTPASTSTSCASICPSSTPPPVSPLPGTPLTAAPAPAPSPPSPSPFGSLSPAMKRSLVFLGLAFYVFSFTFLHERELRIIRASLAHALRTRIGGIRGSPWVQGLLESQVASFLDLDAAQPTLVPLGSGSPQSSLSSPVPSSPSPRGASPQTSSSSSNLPHNVYKTIRLPPNVNFTSSYISSLISHNMNDRVEELKASRKFRSSGGVRNGTASASLSAGAHARIAPTHPCLYFDEKSTGGYWSYEFCPNVHALQFRHEAPLATFRGTAAAYMKGAKQKTFLGLLNSQSQLQGQPAVTTTAKEIVVLYNSHGDKCDGVLAPEGETKRRSASVRYTCCGSEGKGERRKPETFLRSVQEKEICRYELIVCSDEMCSPPPSARASTSSPSSAPYPRTHYMGSARKSENMKVIKEMFQHAYDSYMYNASPSSELKPISCGPGRFELSRTKYVTLLDCMDTLLIMGNYTEFARAVERLRKEDSYTQFSGGLYGPVDVGLFAVDENVSVFETNIRSLGGLLSAHQLCLEFMKEGDVLLADVFDSEFNVKIGSDSYGGAKRNSSDGTKRNSVSEPPLHWKYDGFLLSLAEDLGKRLLPAFETATGIPYGTVNLVRGVPKDETTVASLAGGGSLSLEFELLSRLTGDAIYGHVAMKAVRALWRRRSSLSLLGKHIDVKSGRWVESVSGIGSNSDSFYEYLGKYALIFSDKHAWVMFQDVMEAVSAHMKDGNYYADVDMMKGKSGGHRKRFESLAAFYPGLQVLLGELPEAAASLNSYFAVREIYGFLPERFDYGTWQVEGGEKDSGGAARHPLRPELLESIYLLHRATRGMKGDSSDEGGWLYAFEAVIRDLNKYSKTPCGFASIEDVTTMKLKDSMPSYFLSETLKYLYLTFDDNNVLHATNSNSKSWIFTTEGHPIHHVKPTSMTAPNQKKAMKEHWEEIQKTMKALNFKRNKVQAEATRQRKLVKQNMKKSSYESLEIFLEDDHVAINRDVVDWRWSGRQEFYNGEVLGTIHSMHCHNYQHSKYWLLQVKDSLEYDPSIQIEGGPIAKPTRLDEKKAASGSGSGSGSTRSYCPLENEALPRSLKNKKYPQQENPSHTSQLSMEGLGEFDVSSYADGFVVTHISSGEIIEVSHVASAVEDGYEDYVQVHASYFDVPTGKTEVRATVADLEGNSFDCSVSTGSISMPCTIAGYGRTRLTSLAAEVTSSASPTADHFLRVVGALTVGAKHEKPRRTLGDGCKNSSDLDPVAKGDSIMIVKRGTCTFEAKSRSQSGFSGLVVINGDDSRFIMSKADDKNRKLAEEVEKGYPVTVMVSSDDGKKLIEEIAKANFQQTVGRILLARQDNSMIFVPSTNAEANGFQFPTIRSQKSSDHLRWPVVQTERRAVQVLSKKRKWGLRLMRDEANLGSWTLFIIKVD